VKEKLSRGTRADTLLVNNMTKRVLDGGFQTKKNGASSSEEIKDGFGIDWRAADRNPRNTRVRGPGTKKRRQKFVKEISLQGSDRRR